MHSSIRNNLGEDLTAKFTFSGTIYRWGKNERFWALGKEWEYKGNIYQLIKYGDFKEASTYTWKSYDVTRQSKDFKKRQSDALNEIAAKEKYEKDLKNESCQKKWFPIFTDIPENGTLHPYLEKKKIKKNYLARVKDPTLFIPAYDQNGFNGVQMIYFDPEQDRFVKKFSTGIKKQGSYCPFPNKYALDKAEYIFVAEGFATAASVHEATGEVAVCAFDSGNLFSVVQTLRFLNPNSKIIICADDDKNGVGMKSALKCKHHYSNVVIKKPKFEHKDDKLTDFNDLLCAESIDVVKDQLKVNESDFVQVINLGSHGDKTISFFYFSSMTNRIHQFAGKEHNRIALQQMALKKYWGERYGFKKNQEGEPTETPFWDEIPGRLFIEQADVGFFNPKNVRGVGSWIDDGRFVYNLGNKLLVDGEEVLKIETKYLYQTSTPIVLDEAMSNEEGQKIVECFKSLNYKNPYDHVYILGWIAMAPIFNFIDWRPHIWITGPKGSGKTSILKMISKLIGTDSVYQSVTAAAIRQTLKHDAMPMVIDEAEPGTKESKGRMDEVIEVIRQCSSRMTTKTIRGSSSGEAVEYNVNACFLLGSIQTYLPTEADVSRFFQIEMNSNEGESSAKWKMISREFDEIALLAPKLAARMIQLAPLIKDNIATIRSYLIDNKHVREPRQADQIATSVACYYGLFNDSKLDEFKHDEIITHLVTMLDLDKSSYVEENDNDESENCLDTIYGMVIDKHMMNTVGNYIDRLISSKDPMESLEHAKRSLSAYGLAVIDSKESGKCLAIKTKNFELQKYLKDSGHINYAALLRRHKKTSNSNATFKIDGKMSKGILIKLS